MAKWNLQSIIRIYGQRLIPVVLNEEKKHGVGALVIKVNPSTDKLDVIHLPAKTFVQQPQLVRAMHKCFTQQEVLVLFRPEGSKQEIGVLPRVPAKGVEEID